ncbi:alpha/beta fold hydrolase [Paraburkholderia silviterrae]|uniref:Alpha/beta hydrolase n=1 Tax=Paraburkholderia silviterrae TaxID=2528715 RepID=A0A4R5M309_9BURK|nr:alpha/beta fold hydrolase [Paraburkholderia silviterrae]TDG19998.1 alpha/beta hydrolase [Paraburkholderia silviterrae]
MSTFLLVHGAWHGAWCYTRVAKLLRNVGHDVYTPTLTGLGERYHLKDQLINLDTHIRDVVNVILFEDLTDIVLCGHSYGGMVITGVAGKVGRRIKSLVYLDAFVPENGQSVLDMVGSETATQFTTLAGQTDGHCVPPISAAVFGVNAADAPWVDSMCVPQPFGTLIQKYHYTGEEKLVPNRTYVQATGYDLHAFDDTVGKLKQRADWKMRSLSCGHDVMLDMPDSLRAILLEELVRE